MAESLSRLHNPRRPEPKMEARGKESEGAKIADKKEEPAGDHMHAAAEAMHKAEPHSKHMVLSHDGYGMKSHSINEMGEHEGTHEDEAAHDHVQRFMAGDEGEQHENGMEPEESQSLY